MAAYFFTDQPRALMDAFDARVRQSESIGRIDRWTKGEDGISYTHVGEEWVNKAWLKPRIEDGKLIFNIVRPEDRYVSVKAYAHYFGELIETFTNHLDLNFELVNVTPRCTDGDVWA
ncbi:hypothetical protein MOTC310_24045 [Methylobacterium oryzae]|uniref:Uncharacterized protein n=2 Tax=Methylobacterium oryzae TaxID=334852 RepID=A0ABU7TV78_9HYPH